MDFGVLDDSDFISSVEGEDGDEGVKGIDPIDGEDGEDGGGTLDTLDGVGVVPSGGDSVTLEGVGGTTVGVGTDDSLMDGSGDGVILSADDSSILADEGKIEKK